MPLSHSPATEARTNQICFFLDISNVSVRPNMQFRLIQLTATATRTTSISHIEQAKKKKKKVMIRNRKEEKYKRKKQNNQGVSLL